MTGLVNTHDEFAGLAGRNAGELHGRRPLVAPWEYDGIVSPRLLVEQLRNTLFSLVHTPQTSVLTVSSATYYRADGAA